MRKDAWKDTPSEHLHCSIISCPKSGYITIKNFVVTLYEKRFNIVELFYDPILY